jgi:hypothetical protein
LLTTLEDLANNDGEAAAFPICRRFGWDFSGLFRRFNPQGLHSPGWVRRYFSNLWRLVSLDLSRGSEEKGLKNPQIFKTCGVYLR